MASTLAAYLRQDGSALPLDYEGDLSHNHDKGDNDLLPVEELIQQTPCGHPISSAGELHCDAFEIYEELSAFLAEARRLSFDRRFVRATAGTLSLAARGARRPYRAQGCR